MSDPQDSDGPQTLPESSRLAMPPRLTPSPDATAESVELKRKRQREVSLEPTTPAAGAEGEGSYLDRKEASSRTPLKKNRRKLDPTEEENDESGSGGSGSGSPPIPSVLTSPRQEMRKKVRQISRGVEDITWKSKKDKASAAHEPSLDVQIEADETHDKAEGSPIPTEKQKSEESVDVEVRDAEDTKDDEEAPAAASPKTPEQQSKGLPTEDSKDDTTMEPASPEFSRLHPNGHEKGLKRKFLERGTSHGPPDAAEISRGSGAGEASEPLKRPRDDADKDDNPRETKRPTPPPSPPRDAPPSPKIAKTGGFMAYSSTSSPFASVKGKNIFGAKSASPFSSSIPAAQSSTSSLGSAFGTSSGGASSTTSTTAFARSGFEAFASSSSPFATAAKKTAPVLGATSQLGRSESPASKPSSSVKSNPFASYVGPNQGFAVPVTKKARAGSPDGSARSSLERASGTGSVFAHSASALDDGEASGGEDEADAESSFGAKLRATQHDEEESAWDDDAKPILTEQEVPTGEEDDETIHQVRGKLFSLHDNTWKERGTGLLKLNVKVEDGTGARLLMRKDATYTLLLNVTLFRGMKVSLAQDPRYIRFSAIENGTTTTYNLRVSNAKIAADLLEEINANIPT